MVATSEEVGEDVPRYDSDEIAKLTDTSISWRFCFPGAQHRNGTSEIYAKMFKRSLKHIYGDRNLNQKEFNAQWSKTIGGADIFVISKIWH